MYMASQLTLRDGEHREMKFGQPRGCGKIKKKARARPRQASQPETDFQQISSCQFSTTTTTTTMDVLDKIPKPVLAGFAGLGLLVVLSKVISYIQLLLSLFVLPGKNVSLRF